MTFQMTRAVPPRASLFLASPMEIQVGGLDYFLSRGWGGGPEPAPTVLIPTDHV